LKHPVVDCLPVLLDRSTSPLDTVAEQNEKRTDRPIKRDRFGRATVKWPTIFRRQEARYRAQLNCCRISTG